MDNVVKLFPDSGLSLVDRINRARMARQAAEAAPAETAPDYSVTTRPGYMGATAWDGSNSRRSDLYGAGLSKAIREALKGDGIKGVTVSVKTYTGGQSITLKITATPRDYLELAEYIDATHIWDFSAFGWIVDTDSETGERVSTEAVNGWSHEKMRRVHAELARRDLESMKGEHAQLNHFHIDNYKVFRPDFIKKLHRIAQIVDSFNYDDSNSMVDYFDRGFYESWYIKYADK